MRGCPFEWEADEVDDGLQHRRIGVGVDPVAEVEDVSGVGGPVGEPVVAQHLLGAVEGRLTAGEDEGRIEVALHDQVVAQPTARIADRGAPVETDDRRTGVEHRLEEVVAADAEVDRRGGRVAPAQLTEHVPGVGEHEAVVVAAAQRTGPRVEQLERGGTVGELGVDERDRRLGEAFHELVPEHLVGVHERLRVAVVLAGPPLDQIAGDSERCPGEGEQRHVELGDQTFDRGDHVVDVAELQRPQTLDVVTGPHGVRGDRSGAGCDVDAEADGVRRDDDVAEEHGGVDAVAPHGLQRDLGGQVRLLDRVEDRAVAPDPPVLGE